ncbi:MAG: tryptophan 2,3-dioxygenase family protein [Bdellovibrionota bacterium]|nr:MAG: tryptophan 2,3-dioxygenase family protein [Bdellovibrionota bacterium]
MVTYGEYLKLQQILNAQAPSSAVGGKAAHDEMLFIIVHQAYELWFKEVLHELDSIIEMFAGNFVDETSIGTAVARLQRIIQIQKLLIEQIKVIETLTPLDFLDFRGYLPGASGFQSVQFRMIENRLGLRREERLLYANRPYDADYNAEEVAQVKRTESEPTLFSVVERWLERTPFLQGHGFEFLTAYRQAFQRMVQNDRRTIQESTIISEDERNLRLQMIAQTEQLFSKVLNEKSYGEKREKGEVRLSYNAFLAALFINLYRDQPILHLPFRLLTLLTELDEYLSLWRYRHSLMVLRMLGSKMGTGGSSGHDYLKKTVDKHSIFGDLFGISTLIIPRSELPPLGHELVRELGFFYSHV